MRATARALSSNAWGVAPAFVAMVVLLVGTPESADGAVVLDQKTTSAPPVTSSESETLKGYTAPAGGTTARPAPPPMAAPGTGWQQPAATAAPTQQQMPLPPTYNLAPGAQGGGGLGGSGLPMAPTAYGPWSSPNVAPSPGSGELGFGLTGPQAGPSGFGFVGPPAPTPTATTGPVVPMGVAVSDPRFGPYQPSNIEQPGASRPATTLGPAGQSVLRQPKPFSGYRRPSALSPYINMNRLQDMDRGIDLYNQYVRPQLEQQQENRQVERNLQGLGETARYAQQMLQSNQRPGTIVTSPQKQPATFMNTGQYYGQYNNTPPRRAR